MLTLKISVSDRDKIDEDFLFDFQKFTEDPACIYRELFSTADLITEAILFNHKIRHSFNPNLFTVYRLMQKYELFFNHLKKALLESSDISGFEICSSDNLPPGVSNYSNKICLFIKISISKEGVNRFAYCSLSNNFFSLDWA
jgi:hypothetical protein